MRLLSASTAWFPSWSCTTSLTELLDSSGWIRQRCRSMCWRPVGTRILGSHYRRIGLESTHCGWARLGLLTLSSSLVQSLKTWSDSTLVWLERPRCLNFFFFFQIFFFNSEFFIKKEKEKEEEQNGVILSISNGSTNWVVTKPWIDKNWKLEDWIDKTES